MVQIALESLADRGVVELDEERKAAMGSNLLVVLCGDKATQHRPVPGARCQVPGARCQVPGARCQVPGVRCQGTATVLSPR